MGEPIVVSTDIAKDKTYYNTHQDRDAYIETLKLIDSLKNCVSLIDVGCRSMGLVFKIGNQFKKRTMVDVYKPLYFGGNLEEVKAQGIEINFIHNDFLQISHLPKYDVVICTEVIEHIDVNRQQKFADKLLSITQKHLIVSIPYRWSGSTEPINHNGYNETHIVKWFGKRDYKFSFWAWHLLVHMEIK